MERTVSTQLDITLGSSPGPKVGVVFGSASDWPTMREATRLLEQFGVPCEHGVVSAHRTPDRLRDYAIAAADRGLEVLIAGAGGAAHLPGMIASWTTLPVLGVPIESKALHGMDSLLSIVQMPAGVPVGSLSIGEPGAKNAALLAIRILSARDDKLRDALRSFAAERGEQALTRELDPR